MTRTECLRRSHNSAGKQGILHLGTPVVGDDLISKQAADPKGLLHEPSIVLAKMEGMDKIAQALGRKTMWQAGTTCWPSHSVPRGAVEMMAEGRGGVCV